MRIILWVLVLFGLAWGTLTYFSWNDEVVVLITEGDAGPVETPIWVVDHEDRPWLRGNKTSGWVRRLSLNPAVSLKRGGQTANYTALVVPEKLPEIHRLMQEKYEWRDTMMMAFPRDDTAIRLDPDE